MNKKEIYETLETKANGLEEVCLGLRPGCNDLSEGDIEYIYDALEEMSEAISELTKIKNLIT